MKKIAFLMCSETIGGHEFQSVEIIKLASKFGSCTIFCNTEQQVPLFNGMQIEYQVFDKPFFKNRSFLHQIVPVIKNYYRLRPKLREFDRIIICAGTIEAGISTSFALCGFDLILYVPMYVDRYLLWGKVGLVYNCLSKLFLIPYKSVITINKFQALFFKKKPVIIIPNKIEPNGNVQTVASCDRRLYFVGRLEGQKRLPELIQWLDDPRNKFREFIIVGEGSETERILSLVPKLKYIRVVMKGWLKKPEQDVLFTPSDVLVVNSAYEGDPLIVREANERGSIVISRDIIGVRACTFKRNRFEDQSGLLMLLNKAFLGELTVYKNEDVHKVEQKRKHAAEKLFV